MGYGNVAPAPVMVCADAEIYIAVSKIANNCFTRVSLVRQLFRPICVTILLHFWPGLVHLIGALARSYYTGYGSCHLQQSPTGGVDIFSQHICGDFFIVLADPYRYFAKFLLKSVYNYAHISTLYGFLQGYYLGVGYAAQTE